MTDMEVGADEFYTFMLKFYEKFPELKTNKFFLSGESYAGKYIPQFAHTILEANKKSPDFVIPLTSVIVFDGLPSVEIERTNMHAVPYALGILDQNNMNQISVLEQRCQIDHT